MAQIKENVMAVFDKSQKTWRADISINGKRYRKRGFTSKRNAELYEAQLIRQQEKRVLELPVTEHMSIKELFLLYTAHMKEYLKPRSAERDIGSLNTWEKFFKKELIFYLSEIDSEAWARFREWRKKISLKGNKLPSERTINLDLITINKCFKWAIKKRFLSENPFKDMELYKQKKPSLPRYLTVEEIEAVEDYAAQNSQHFLPCFSVLVRTGIRSGELCSLEINNIDFERKQIILRPHQTKAGDMRRVPFKDNVAKIFQKQIAEAQKSRRSYLFVTKTGSRQDQRNLNRRFRTILGALEKQGKICNSKEIHIHSLRRTYISHLIMAGVEAVKVMAIVGHKEWSTIRRYLVLSPDYIGEGDDLPY